MESRRRRGRPKVPSEIRRLIREMSLANPLWGAPRIHGELLKLRIDVRQTSVAKYMARRRRPPSQGWRTFLLNHADGIASRPRLSTSCAKRHPEGPRQKPSALSPARPHSYAPGDFLFLLNHRSRQSSPRLRSEESEIDYTKPWPPDGFRGSQAHMFRIGHSRGPWRPDLSTRSTRGLYCRILKLPFRPPASSLANGLRR